MQMDGTALFNEAASRSGVSLSQLTEADVTVSSALRHVVGSVDHFDEIVADCTDPNMRLFLRAVLEILVEDPNIIPATTGYSLKMDKLATLYRAI